MATIRFNFSGARQDKEARDLQQGELVEDVNTRQVKVDGGLEKRLGYDKVAIASFNASGAPSSYTGPATHMEHGGDVLMWRDSVDAVWVYEEDSGRGVDRGIDPRCFPRWYSPDSAPRVGRTARPVAVLKGGDIWLIAISRLSTNANNVLGYTISVFDATTRVQKYPTVTITASGAVHIAAAVDGSNNVWVFWTLRSSGSINVIKSHKYTLPFPSAVPVEATYKTFGGSPNHQITSIDAKYYSSPNKIAVVATTVQAGTPRVLQAYASFLDTATGAESGSPASTITSTNGGNGSPQVTCCGGISLAEGDDASGGSFYFCYAREKAAVTSQVEYVDMAVATSNLAQTPTVMGPKVMTNSYANVVAQTAGYKIGSERIWFTSYWEFHGGGIKPTGESLIFTERWSTLSPTVPATFNRSTYVAGKPYQHNFVWYTLLGFDDGYDLHAQRSYLVYRSDGYLLSPVLAGESAGLWHNVGALTAVYTLLSLDRVDYDMGATHVVTPLNIGGNKFVYPLLRELDTVEDPNPTIVEIDMAAVYHSSAPEVVPGGFPKFAGPLDRLRELATVMTPYDALAVNPGTGSQVRSVNRLAYRFIVPSADGKLRPTVQSSIIQINFLNIAVAGADGYTIQIPTNRHTNDNRGFVQLLASVCAGTDLFVQHTIANDPFVDGVTVTLSPQNFTSRGESLDTLIGSLDGGPVPPSRLAIIHNGRLWLGGTPDDEIWPSLELRSGRGYQFNEVLVIEGRRGKGELQAWASLDDKTLAAAWINKILFISGDGPDGNGNGAFDVRALAGADGFDSSRHSPGAFLQGPLGVYFPRARDGRMCLLTAGGVQEIHQGMESYAGYTWTGAVDDKTNRELRWVSSNGKILRLDYGHPLADQPWGRWKLDEVVNAPAWIGIRSVNGTPYMLDPLNTTQGAFWRQGTTYLDAGLNEIAKRIELGRLAPAGVLGEFDTDQVTLSCDPVDSVNGNLGDYRYTLRKDGTVQTETHNDIFGIGNDVNFRSALYRAREVSLKIEETFPSGPGTRFDSVVIETNEYDRPNTGKRRIG